MAREAKTIRQHLLHGTVPQGRPEKPSVYQGGRAKIPAHLSRAGRTEFKRYAKILEDRSTCTPGDFATLALLAEASARWISLKRQIGDEFMVTTQVTDNNGNLRTTVSSECQFTGVILGDNRPVTVMEPLFILFPDLTGSLTAKLDPQTATILVPIPPPTGSEPCQPLINEPCSSTLNWEAITPLASTAPDPASPR